MPLYADIILPLAQNAYTFLVPAGIEVEAGHAVALQFGPRKFYTGIVRRVHTQRPAVKTVKPIHRVLYGAPLVDVRQLELWEWIASYYMCSLGEVMRVALPSLAKPSGDTALELADDEFRPRKEIYVALPEHLHDEAAIGEVFEKLERRAPKQYAALLEVASTGECAMGETPRRLLNADYAALNTLCRKGYIVFSQRDTFTPTTPAQPSASSFSAPPPAPDSAATAASLFRLPELTPHQRGALDSLRARFAAGTPTALLHGITSSGKTETYIHLIAETLARGGDVLLLVPEIALTSQLIDRLERIFAGRVTPYHSRLTARRRTETYLRLARSHGGELVVGARSAMFLPLKNLQLIVVDEEHDASYKQSDSAPRYHARDCAVMLARLFSARALLVSATPSLETWLNAQSGKYGLATLKERYGDAAVPRIFISDTLRAARRGERRSHFNKLLSDKIADTLARGEQVMLFQNRRGFSPYVECSACGWTARCPDCNVTLAYHKNLSKLTCHYCGRSAAVPSACPSCGAGDVAPMGFGTEKIEQQTAHMFPSARVARLDRDAVTSQRALRVIVADFEARRTDILVGTQMITKGFDFEGVSLVGILNADNLLNNPDFRTLERAFQLMTQVAGRTGRRERAGEVVIQTAEPSHPLFEQIVAHDYEAMARAQLAEREAFSYPPYGRLTALTLRHGDDVLLHRAAGYLAQRLRTRFHRRVLGPMAPPVDRIRGEYLINILLKIERGASAKRAREILSSEIKAFLAEAEFRKITVIVDVDPQ